MTVRASAARPPRETDARALVAPRVADEAQALRRSALPPLQVCALALQSGALAAMAHLFLDESSEYYKIQRAPSSGAFF